MGDMFKALLTLMMRTQKVWILPVLLLLVILGLLIIGAHSSSVPIFLYPLI